MYDEGLDQAQVITLSHTMIQDFLRPAWIWRNSNNQIMNLPIIIVHLIQPLDADASGCHQLLRSFQRPQQDPSKEFKLPFERFDPGWPAF